MDQFNETASWDGWEHWYFGSDYVEAAGLPSEHWAIDSAWSEGLHHGTMNAGREAPTRPQARCQAA